MVVEHVFSDYLCFCFAAQSAAILLLCLVGSAAVGAFDLGLQLIAVDIHCDQHS